MEIDRCEVREEVKESIEYEHLRQELPYDDVESLLELIVDVLSSNASAMRIGGEVLPVDAVRRRFRQLDSEHIKYVIDSLRQTTTKINIVSSLESITTPLQRALQQQILSHIDDLNRRVAVLDEMVEQYMAEYAHALEALDEIPGIARRSAQVILAEVGLDMNRFPSAAHLCSWAGVSPCNHQSAGKRKHDRTNKGNKTLKSMLVQCAKAAGKVKSSYFFAQYQRIAAQRGKNRATIAVAHSILTVIWHILKYNVP